MQPQTVRTLGPLARFAHYIAERFRIYVKRHIRNQPPPWTDDPILQTYKFTNVKRDWDYTSRWLEEYWYRPYREARSIGFACAIARFINFVPTLVEIGYPRWKNFDRLEAMLQARKNAGQQVLTNAYLLVGGMPAGSDKIHHLVHMWLKPVWKSNLLLRWWPDPYDLHEELTQFTGWGDFLSQEVILDWMHHTHYGLPISTKRKDRYAVLGPGGLRGLNRVLERQPDAKMDRGNRRYLLEEVHEKIRRQIPAALKKAWTLHDTQFNLCEFDKYERALWGQGQPKHRFTPRDADGSSARPERGGAERAVYPPTETDS